MNESWRELFPFKSHFLSIAGQQYHYLDEGRGAPVVMVHGNPTWSFYWRNVVQRFRQSHRMLAVDHIGCGMSDKPADYSYTIRQHIDNLVHWLRELDLKEITLLVHDWGGAIGLGAAVEEPQRFDRIVLFNTAAFPPPYVPFRIRLCRTPFLGTAAIRGLNLFARAALWMAVENRDTLTASVRQGLIAPYDCWAHRIAIDRFVKEIPFTRRHPTWQTLSSIEQRLERLADRPIQIIWGMKDWCFTPTCLDRFVRHFPTAGVQRIETAGHYVVEEAVDEVLDTLTGFLGQDNAPAKGSSATC